MPTPNRGIPYVPEGTLDPAAGLNISLDQIDAKFLPAVISMALSSPPGSPADGDMYVAQPGSSGAWSGLGNQLVRYRSEGSFWQNYEPDEVWLVFNKANDQIYYWNGDSSGAWSSYGGGGGGGDAEDISYNNAGSGLAATNVQDAVDELAAEIAAIDIDSNSGGGGGDLLDNFAPFAFRMCAPGNAGTGTVDNVGAINLTQTGGSPANDVPTNGSDFESRLWTRTTGGSPGTNSRVVWHDAINANGVFHATGFSPTSGFQLSIDFAYKDAFGATFDTDGTLMIGLLGTNSVPGGSEVPSNQINSVFIGKDIGDTNLQMMHNDGAGICTKVDLGVTATSRHSTALRLVLISNGTTITYQITRLDTGASIGSGTLSSNLPASGNRLYPLIYAGSGSANTHCTAYLGRVLLLPKVQ